MLAGLCSLSACNESTEPISRQGELRLSSLGVEVTNADKVYGSRAVVNVANYIVDICRSGETEPVQSYIYGQMPSVVTLTPGEYVVNVRSHNVERAAWDAPYFEGQSEQFSIKADDITDVDPIKCSFASLKVSVIFGEKLRKVMGDDVTVTVMANDEGRLVYTPDDERDGYFAVVDGSTTLIATFTGTVSGNEETITKIYTDVAAGQHRKITFEIGKEAPEPDSPTGSVDHGEGVSVNVTYFDDDLTGEVGDGIEDAIDNPGDMPGKLPELPDEPGNDDPVTPPADEDGFDFKGSTLENGKTYMNTDFSDAKPAEIKINCPDGIAKAEVIIDSDFLTPEELEGVGLADKFDLCNPGALREPLEAFGFPCGENITDHTEATVNVTQFMPLLGIGAGSTSKFTFTITDKNGVVKVTTFTIKVA